VYLQIGVFAFEDQEEEETFNRTQMGESKRKRDSQNKPENSDTETDEETLRDLDKKQRAKNDEEIAA
jgi:hypothetical protein